MGDVPSFQRQETVAPNDGQASVKPEHHTLDDMPLFLRAVAYSGLQTPVNALAQIADHFGANVQSHVQFVSPAEGGNSFLDKAQVMTGNAIGMFVPYAIGGAASKKLLGIGAGESAVARLGTGAFSLSVKEAALTGGLTGLVLQPGQDGPGHNFWASRAYNGLSGAVTFSVMSASALKLKGFGETVPIFKSDAVVGAVAGFPAGALNVQMDSLLQNHKLAPLGQTLESAATMSIIGGAFGAVHDARGAYKNYYSGGARTTARLPVGEGGEPRALFGTVNQPVPPIAVDVTTGGAKLEPPPVVPVITNEAALVAVRQVAPNPVPINTAPFEVTPNQVPIGVAPLEIPAESGAVAISASPEAQISASDQTITTFRPKWNTDLGGHAIPDNSQYLRVGRTDITLKPGGATVPIGRDQVGSNFVSAITAENPGGHAQLGLTASGEPYLKADPGRALNTFIKRKGANVWSALVTLPYESNGGVIVGYGDQVRLGEFGGANLDLSDITPARFKIGNTDVTLMPGQRKLIGRDDIDPTDLAISRKHVGVGIDTSGRAYIREDPDKPSTYGTFIKRQGAPDFTRVVPGAEVHVFPGDDVRFGKAKNNPQGLTTLHSEFPDRVLDLSNMYKEINDAATPELTSWGKFKQRVFGTTADGAGTVVRTQNGGIRYHDGRGLIDEDPNGSKTITDYSGAVMREFSGRIINMTDANGAQFRYQYAPDGRIQQVFFGNTPYPQSPGMSWSLERDGSLHLTQDRGNGFRQETIYRPDGSQDSASVAPGTDARFETKKINLNAEKTRIDQMSEVQLPAEDVPRFKGMLRALEASSLTQEQQGQVLHQLNRLLSEDPNALLKPTERAVLAQEALQQVMNPAVIDQGSSDGKIRSRKTCTVAALEKKVASEDPGEYVRIVADAASTGRYVNADGKSIDLNETGTLQIDDQAAANLRRGLPNPIKELGDNNRSWVSKIFQQTALNLLLEERSAGAVKYMDRGDHEAQVHANNLQGRTIVFNRGGVLEPLRNPNIVDGTDLETMYQKLTGKQQNFWLTADVSGTADVPVRLGNQVIGGAADLGRVLRQMQADGVHGVADIDVRNSPFWQTSGYGAAGGAGGVMDNFPDSRGLQARRHAVFIKDIDMQYVHNLDGSILVQNGHRVIDLNQTKVSMLNS